MRSTTFFEIFEKTKNKPSASAFLKRMIIDQTICGAEFLSDLTSPKKTKQIVSSDLLLPPGWIWASLSELGKINAGNSVNAKTKEELYRNKDGRPFIATKDVGYGLDRLSYENGQLVNENDKRFRVAPAGAVLVCAEGGSAGKKVGLTDRPICFGNKLLATITNEQILPEYLVLFFMSGLFRTQFTSLMTGVIGGISQANFKLIQVPLPPLSYQKAAIRKTNENLNLLKKVEAAIAKRNAYRTDHLRACVTNFSESIDRLKKQNLAAQINHLVDNSLREPCDTQLLKSFVLDSLVAGHLTQNRSEASQEEEVEETIERLQNQKKANLLEHDVRYGDLNIPKTWKILSLDQIIVQGPQNGISPKQSQSNEAPKSITLTATTSGKFDARHYKHVDLPLSQASPYLLEPGDLLFQRGNSLDHVGIAAIYDGPLGEFIFPDLIIRTRVSPIMNIGFVHLCCIASHARRYFQENARGAQATMPKINQQTLRKFPLPIPSRREQDLIMVKAERLLKTINSLETSLKRTSDIKDDLLRNLVA